MTRDYLTTNRDIWNVDAPNWVNSAERLWQLQTPEWGNWANSEDCLHLLPAEMRDMDAIELGCGTGYVSGWMNRRGARVTAIDISKEQLATARRIAEQHNADITFIEGNAEKTGLPDASFDFAISEYGASIWCPPDKWLREAWRLLRPGSRLVFLGDHPLSLICSPVDGSPADRTLHRPYRGMWGADWTEVENEPSGVCFNLTTSSWIELFNEIGFSVISYQELYAHDGDEGTRGAVPADWAKSHPIEQVWHLDKPE